MRPGQQVQKVLGAYVELGARDVVEVGARLAVRGVDFEGICGHRTSRSQEGGQGRARKYEGKGARVGAAQFVAVAGNITANAAAHERLIDGAGGLGVEVLVFPELSLTGYASSGLDEAPERCVLDPGGPHLNPVGDACRRNRIVAALYGGRGDLHGRAARRTAPAWRASAERPDFPGGMEAATTFKGE